MNFLEKIRQLPPEKRKVIVWAVVVFLGILLVFLWIFQVKRTIMRIEGNPWEGIFDKEAVEEDLQDFPMFELPEIDEENLKSFLERLEEEGLENLDPEKLEEKNNGGEEKQQ